jgi:hypothetical protein
MLVSHVPILLGSYNATLEVTDQLVLQVSLAVKRALVFGYQLN